MPDTVPGNNTTTAAFELSGNQFFGSFDGRIDSLGDTDWIKLNLFGAVPYNFFGHMTGIGVHQDDVQLRLLDANGNEVVLAEGFNGDTNFNNSYFTFTPGASGTYYLEVSQDEGVAMGEYNVFMSRLLMSVATPQNEFDNVVMDSDAVTGGSNTLVGGAGDDRLDLGVVDVNLIGEQGDDRLFGNNLINIMSGGLGHDLIVGLSGDDYLSGDGGDDSISGGFGFDQILGGAGFDFLSGDENNDWMSGGANDDQMFGGTGDDEMFGGDGDDVINGDDDSDDLDGGNGNDTLIAGLGNDSVIGGAGNDWVDGSNGLDEMVGGLGNDTYTVTEAGDTTVEAANGGTDTVLSFVTRTLGANLEQLTLVGTSAINGTGNTAANTIRGNAFANKLLGQAGNDRLIGNDGADTLTGGLGIDTLTGGNQNDIFVFSSALVAANRDNITDFNQFGNDTIHLNNAIFKTVGANGVFKGAALKLGTVATQADDRIIYNKLTGKLFYDSDGTGAAAQIHFATLTNKPATLGAADFFVI
jgi:Ca2+-binding RTX toxin-like protein